jgi:DNA helicase II / ATP-dependent DNA helicase PcrA
MISGPDLLRGEERVEVPPRRVSRSDQDTNRLQSSILLALKSGGRGLTVVGDDAQSIYSFRAATVRNILDFPNQFSPPANIITLDRNYRSTQPVLAAANGVIGFAKERFTKNLWTERTSAAKPQLVSVRDEADQARFIVERILENRESGTLLKEQAVLFRTSSHSGPLEIELTRRNIPFVKFGGLKFLDAAHIKDMLALLRFIPEKLLGLFERTAWPLVPAGTTARAASQGPKLDIGARMRGMWR